MTDENPYGWIYNTVWDNWDRHPGRESFREREGEGPFSDYRDQPFDFDLFYSFFPEFQPDDSSTDAPQYSRVFLAAVAKQAAMFIKPSWCRELDGHDRTYAYLLAVAHMAVLTKNQQSGLAGTSVPGTGATSSADTMPGVMTSASVGGVSVSKSGIVQPKNFFEAFYYQTPYGRTLLTFLEQQVSAGLMYEGEENIANCLRD